MSLPHSRKNDYPALIVINIDITCFHYTYGTVKAILVRFCYKPVEYKIKSIYIQMSKKHLVNNHWCLWKVFFYIYKIKFVLITK